MPFDGTNYAELSQKLLECADILEREGWCQNALFNGSAYCALGIIHKVGEHKLILQELMLKTVKHVLNLKKGGDIITWNDDPSRSKEEVTTAFRQAAQIAQKS
jgi:hypothetical protein